MSFKWTYLHQLPVPIGLNEIDHIKLSPLKSNLDSLAHR